MHRDIIIVLVLLIVLIAMVGIFINLVLDAKKMISEINIFQLQKCAILDCDITPLGGFSCKTIDKGVELKNDSFMMI